jgi:cyclohexa-1,5-dienecarbonyl-CoA hydratase
MAVHTDDPHDVDVYSTTGEREYKHIRYDVADGIARLTLQRPPANVLSIEAMEDLGHALESLEYRRDIKLIVISGEGKYFSAGFELGEHLGDSGYVMLEAFRDIFRSMETLDKPTLAVVAGPALGAGSMLALGCDMVFAGSSAKFGHPEIRAGVFNSVAAALLPRMIGRKRAYEMILGGGSLTAAEAFAAGLITRVCPDDRLATEAEALIKRFQELSAAVIQAARRAIAGSLDLQPTEEALRHTDDVYLNQLMATEDAEEGLRAVMAKRKPEWKNR